MASQPPKHNIADFFKPRSTCVPQKRPSPSADDSQTARPNKARSPTPKTPASGARFKDVTSSPFKPISGAGPPSGSAVSMPFRSPHPQKVLAHPTYGPGPLFGAQKARMSQSRSRDSSPAYSTPKRTPELTLADVPRTSRSVVRNDELVEVLDSDEDSLISLDDFFGKRKGGSTTSSSSPLEQDAAKIEAERIKSLSIFTRGRSDPIVGRDKLRALAAKERDHKFDIGRLMGDHFDDEEIESNVSKARMRYQASTNSEFSQNCLDRNLLASVVRAEDGESDSSRLLNAVERTEAFTSETSFSFFGPGGMTARKDESPDHDDLPDHVAIDHLWQGGDERARDRAFSSGHVADAAVDGKVPGEVLKWGFERIVLESRDDIRAAIVQVLQHGSTGWTRTNVTARDVQTIFQTLGTAGEVLLDGSAITPKPQAYGERLQGDPKYLLATLELFRSIVADMDFTALSKLTSMTARLALDAEVMHDGRVSVAVESTISSLMNLPDSGARQHVAERLLSDMGQHLHEPYLQSQLLEHVLPTSKSAANVRVALAHVFLSVSNLNLDPSQEAVPISLARLTKLLDSSVFKLDTRSDHMSTDYAKLKALAYIFDTAIADGGRPASFSARADEVAFNRHVDKLADRVKSIFASIADTGASHMRRTEAKEALQAVYYRLLYSVRTEPRPKKNVFGGRDGSDYRAEERSKGFMTGFLAKMKEKKAFQEQDDELVPSASMESQESESQKLIRKQLQLS